MKNEVTKIKIDKDRYIDYLKLVSRFSSYPGCSECSYHGFCFYFPDPHENPDKDFSDFCIEAGNKFGGSGYPYPGELERLFPGRPDIDGMIKHNPPVRLHDIIHRTCGVFCQFYDPRLINCGGHNRLCLLKDLFKDNETDR